MQNLQLSECLNRAFNSGNREEIDSLEIVNYGILKSLLLLNNLETRHETRPFLSIPGFLDLSLQTKNHVKFCDKFLAEPNATSIDTWKQKLEVAKTRKLEIELQK